MGDNRQTTKMAKMFDIFVEAFNFIIMQYLLACGLISFRANFLMVILFSTNVFTIAKYWGYLEKSIEKRTWRYLIFVISIAVVAIFLICFGYFPISVTIKKGVFK